MCHFTTQPQRGTHPTQCAECTMHGKMCTPPVMQCTQHSGLCTPPVKQCTQHSGLCTPPVKQCTQHSGLCTPPVKQCTQHSGLCTHWYPSLPTCIPSYSHVHESMAHFPFAWGQCGCACPALAAFLHVSAPALQPCIPRSSQSKILSSTPP
jgi:hypothetical protein